MKRLLALIVVLSFLSVGCEDDEATAKRIRQENQETLDGEGYVVGTLPDGRVVRRYTILYQSGHPNHFVYVIEGVPTTTVNQEVRVSDGEDTHTELHSNVTVDGVQYVPKKK